MIYLSAIQMWKPYVGENCPFVEFFNEYFIRNDARLLDNGKWSSSRVE